MRTPVMYEMIREKEVVAFVATMPNGKCLVSWPTSTIVYDSEKAARDVHIKHMGGRGSKTTFSPMMASEAFMYGYQNAIQDKCEGCPDASGPKAPKYIKTEAIDDYEAGYTSASLNLYGEEYTPDISKWQG